MESSPDCDARARFIARLGALQSRRSSLESSIQFLSRLRGVLFLAFLFLLICGASKAAPPVICYWAAGAVFVTFVVIVSRSDGCAAARDIIALRQTYYEQLIARLERSWSQLPVEMVERSREVDILARDLDLFGAASLFQLVSEAHTPFGRARLVDWLTTPAEPAEIVSRQEAVAWLAPEFSRREEIAVAARSLDVSGARPDVFREWGESASWLAQRPHVRWLAVALAIGIVGISALVLVQVVPAVCMLAVYLLIIISLLFNAIYLGTVHDIFNQITVGRYELGHYQKLFLGVWDLPNENRKFQVMRQRLGDGASGFQSALKRLSRLVVLASGRRAGAASLLYIIGQLLTCWDFHVLARLELWQRRFGTTLSGWFESVAELEALCSFASVAELHPSWCYPRVGQEKTSSVLAATELGHPLLPPEACVRNDVDVGTPGTFLLVTGSNMSGKSTLLRALGLNAVLAQAGCVACASRLEMVQLQLATSMRISDSLVDGVSFFMAELKRLKGIVDEARECHAEQDRQLLFLLDEILQGTNSRERHLAVERILGHLVEMKAAGAVSTHDLELARSPALAKVCKTVHFRESFQRDDKADSMQFDYTLRTGLCPTTNALKLMELVGLGSVD